MKNKILQALGRFKPISISLSPNVEKDDVFLALKLIFQPWLWIAGKTTPSHSRECQSVNAIDKFEKEFAKYIGVKHCVSFNSGRSALFAILKALTKIDPAFANGSGVAMQSFTCNAVPNPILWAGLEPVYVDCSKENFNIDIADLKNKIEILKNKQNYSHILENKRIVLIVQHTFGLPANMDEIMFVARENNLFLIEDCAHSLGAEWRGRKVGTFGDAALFSFSRDKVISSVYGGMAITNNDKIGNALRQAQNEFGAPNSFWIFQQLLHPILLYFLILPMYNFLDMGKIFLVLFQWFYILSKAVHWKEKKGQKPDYFPKAMPGALSILALHQLKKIDKFYNHRKKLFEYYLENLKNTSFTLPKVPENSKPSYLRFTVRHPNAHSIIYSAWHKENILLGDWYTSPIAPFDTNLTKMRYNKGSCPNAEKLANETLNLPTHINISEKDAEKIVKFLKQWK